MLRLLLRVGAPAALVFALLYQRFLKDFVALLGIGRRAQPLSDFPYTCHRIQDEGLQSCKDLWLAEETRTLYMLCADHRQTSYEQESDTSRNGSNDVIVALELDKRGDTNPNYRYLTTPSFPSGGTQLSALSGLSHTNGASLFLVSAHISADDTANPTIEHFLHLHTSSNLTHRHTFVSPYISYPRALAPVDHPIAVFFTNTHSPTANSMSALLPNIFPDVFPTGSLGLRDSSDTAAMHVATGLRYPTGLVYSHSGYGEMYVSHSVRGGGGVSVFAKSPGRGWWQSHSIKVPYASEHLSLDQKGDVWLVAKPSLWNVWWGGESGGGKATVVRVRRDESEPGKVLGWKNALGIKSRDREWHWEKVFEDGEGEVLEGVDRVVSDTETGKLFLSGGKESGLVVCDRI